jgi:hypothetical protein
LSLLKKKKQHNLSKKQTITNIGEALEKLESSQTVCGNTMVHIAPVVNSLAVPQNIKHKVPIGPIIYLKEYTQPQKTYTQCSQQHYSKQPSETNQMFINQIHETWSSHTTEYHSVTKRKER